MDSSIAIINLVPFLLSLLMVVPAVKTTLKKTGLAWLMAGTMAVLFVWLLTFLPQLESEPVRQFTWAWVPDLGMSLTWYLDGFSLMFALIVTGVGIAVFFYAGYYLDTDDEAARFYMLLSAFAGAMLALVLAGNVIMLFVAWELTSIISFLLIGFKGYKSEAARVGASRALVITGGGGLALLVGLVLMAAATGSYQIADIISNPDLINHQWYAAFTVLIMLGCFTKSAQFPFHFWLPGGMSAPSPASAYLHSATMVKAGIYLLFRFYPTLGNTSLWEVGLVGVGLTTMLIGAVFAIRKRDLKGLLAYSTVSKLGALVALIGLPDEHGLKAAMIGILAHAMYKGTFFLMAGTVEHSTGTRNLDQLGGLMRRMPLALTISALVGLSMAGFPPLLGFAAKEFLLEAMLPFGTLTILAIIVTVTASVLTVVAALLFVWDVFISRPDQEYEHFHAPGLGLNAGPALLAGMSLLSGFLIAPFFQPFVTAMLGESKKLYLIPPEFSTAAALSVAVLIVGPVVFALRRYWLVMPWFKLPTGEYLYAQTIRGVEVFADFLLTSQNGKLRHYLIVIMGVVAGMMVLGGTDSLRPINITIDESTDWLKIMLLLLTIGSTLGSIILRRHLLAALSMGVMGYAVGGLFLLEPAPDVALVQFLVETLATVLIILILTRISLRQRSHVMSVLWRGAGRGNFGIYRDIAISAVIGISVGLFALAAVNDREARIAASEPIAQWHLDNAYPETGVTDVVSSILADFRGTDTLIEITVFSMAALGVLTLLTMPKGGELLTGRSVTDVMNEVLDERANITASGSNPIVGAGSSVGVGSKDKAQAEHIEMETQEIPINEFGAFEEANDIPRFSTPLARIVATVVLPFALLISLSHVLYGAEGPGDGFTAGVVSGLAVALWYVVFGYFEARARLRWLRPGRLIAAGLLIAITNAILGIFFSEGFFNIIKIGDGSGPAGIHLASTLIFEFSIFLTVFGGVTMIMEAIAHPEDVEDDIQR